MCLLLAAQERLGYRRFTPAETRTDDTWGLSEALPESLSAAHPREGSGGSIPGELCSEGRHPARSYTWHRRGPRACEGAQEGIPTAVRRGLGCSVLWPSAPWHSRTLKQNSLGSLFLINSYRCLCLPGTRETPHVSAGCGVCYPLPLTAYRWGPLLFFSGSEWASKPSVLSQITAPHRAAPHSWVPTLAQHCAHLVSFPALLWLAFL